MSGVSSFKFEKVIVFSRGRVNFLEGEVIISLTGGKSCPSTGEESRSIGKGDMIEASKVDGPVSIIKGSTSSINSSNFLSNGTNGGLIHNPFLAGYLSIPFKIPVSLAGEGGRITLCNMISRCLGLLILYIMSLRHSASSVEITNFPSFLILLVTSSVLGISIPSSLLNLFFGNGGI